MTDLDHPRTRPGPAPVGAADLPLERLVALCRLTPDQARVLAADVLGALAGDPGDSTDPTIRVGRDGRARWCPGADGREVARAALDRLVDACAPGTLPARLVPLVDAEGAVAHPGEVPTELDVGEVRDAGARRALGAVVVRATRDELPRDVTPAPPAVGGPVPARPWSWRRAGRTAWRRTWPWAFALLVLLAVVGVEVVLLRGRIAGDLEALHAAGAPVVPTTVAPAPAGPPAMPVPVPAPPAAGPVVGVDLRAVPPPCTPGAVCPVRLLVRLRAPGPGEAPPAVVTWHVEVVDRCTGARTVAAGDRVPVPAGAAEVYGLASVTVPPGRSLALVPVVDTPARAAGDPLSVGGATC